MPVTVYSSKDQLTYLQSILTNPTVLTYLGISANIKDANGVDTGVPNTYAVSLQSPYFLMNNYLPQIVLNVGSESPTDQQFSQADFTTSFDLYYVLEFQLSDQTVLTMTDKLTYIARYLLGTYRTSQPFWYTMDFPRLEVMNEVHRFYEEAQINIAVGRLNFTVTNKGDYR